MLRFLVGSTAASILPLILQEMFYSVGTVIRAHRYLHAIRRVMPVTETTARKKACDL